MKKFTAFIAALILSLTISVPVLAEPSENSTADVSVSASSDKEENSDEESTAESSSEENSNEESTAESSSEENSDEESTAESSSEENSDEESTAESSSEENSNEESTAENSSEEKSEESVPEESKQVSYTSYAIPEAGMYISFPNDMQVITRTIENDSPVLKSYKLTKEEVLKNFEETDTYLKASAWDFSYDITVNVLKNDDTETIGNLSSLSDSEMKSIVDNILKQSVYTGCSYTKYNNSLYLSFPMEYDSGKTKVKGIQKYTIVRGARIVITFQSYNGEIDENLDNVITEVMNSVVFDGINPNPEEPKKQQSVSVNDLDIRYIYLMIASVLAVIFLMLMIITAMRYKKSQKLRAKKKADFVESAEEPQEKTEDVPAPAEEPQEKSQNLPAPAEEKQEETEMPPESDNDVSESVGEEPQKEEEEETLPAYPVAENQLEIVEIAFRIIPMLKPESDDDTEIWNFISKKTADLEFFASHAPKSYSNANAFYRINAGSNILNAPNGQIISKEEPAPQPKESIDEAIRKETLETVAGDKKPEELELEAPQTEKEEPDLNELVYSVPENIVPVAQDIEPYEEEEEPSKSDTTNDNAKIKAMNKSEMKLGNAPKRPKNEIYKADEEVPVNQTIQLEIAKSDDGSIKIGANNGTKSLDVEIEDVSKKN